MAWLFGRSMRTVWKQQRAWRLFAAKHNLIYERPFWYKAPLLDGEIRGRRIRIYVDEIVDPVLRVREFRTTVEVYFLTGFPTGVTMGSRTFHPTIRAIDNLEALLLPAESEFAGVIAMGREGDVAERYIQSRLAPLRAFFGQPKSERLLMGYEADGFLVLQSADPLDEVKRLNTKVKELFQLIEKLEPGLGDALPVEAADAVPEAAEIQENPESSENVVVTPEAVSIEETSEPTEAESEVKA